MKQAKKVIQPIRKPIKRVSNWCHQIWDGVSGKDYRRLKQLRHDLTVSQQKEATLVQQLTQASAQCTELERVIVDCKKDLVASQQALEESQQQFTELWQELDELVADSDQQIQTLSDELASQTEALTTCEANLDVAIQRSQPVQTRSVTTSRHQHTPLADWKIGFVGGHSATRRVVSRTLRANHGLVYAPVEIPSHREASTSQKQLKNKLADCDLVVSIVRYSNHSLTKSLMQLKEKGALKAAILIPNSRGVSGVVRDILSFVNQNPELAK